MEMLMKEPHYFPYNLSTLPRCSALNIFNQWTAWKKESPKNKSNPNSEVQMALHSRSIFSFVANKSDASSSPSTIPECFSNSVFFTLEIKLKKWAPLPSIFFPPLLSFHFHLLLPHCRLRALLCEDQNEHNQPWDSYLWARVVFFFHFFSLWMSEWVILVWFPKGRNPSYRMQHSDVRWQHTLVQLPEICSPMSFFQMQIWWGMHALTVFGSINHMWTGQEV